MSKAFGAKGFSGVKTLWCELPVLQRGSGVEIFWCQSFGVFFFGVKDFYWKQLL